LTSAKFKYENLSITFNYDIHEVIVGLVIHHTWPNLDPSLSADETSWGRLILDYLVGLKNYFLASLDVII
jgi:hypothetical protein